MKLLFGVLAVVLVIIIVGKHLIRHFKSAQETYLPLKILYSGHRKAVEGSMSSSFLLL